MKLNERKQELASCKVNEEFVAWFCSSFDWFLIIDSPTHPVHFCLYPEYQGSTIHRHKILKVIELNINQELILYFNYITSLSSSTNFFSIYLFQQFSDFHIELSEISVVWYWCCSRWAVDWRLQNIIMTPWTIQI